MAAMNKELGKTSRKEPIRLIVVEDYELSRNGIIVSLQKKSDFEIVSEAEQGDDALVQILELKPDVVLMDIELPVMDGIQVTKQVKEKLPDVKIIMLTSHSDSEDVFAAFGAGADAYCMKDVPVERLIQVIEMVQDGAVWLDPAIAKYVMDVIPSRSGGGSNIAKGEKTKGVLTERELEILQDIVDGKSNQEIADHLIISLHTVKVHVRNIIEKLAVEDRTQAAVKAIRDGFVQLD